jgi:hypothetical protein
MDMLNPDTEEDKRRGAMRDAKNFILKKLLVFEKVWKLII